MVAKKWPKMVIKWPFMSCKFPVFFLTELKIKGNKKNVIYVVAFGPIKTRHVRPFKMTSVL